MKEHSNQMEYENLIQKKLSEIQKCVGNPETISVGKLAEILSENGFKISQSELFDKLRKDGFLVRQAGKFFNGPTQKSIFNCLISAKEKKYSPFKTGITPMITEKGQKYFINKYCPKTLRFPCCDQE